MAATLTLATDVVYVLVSQSQGEGDLGRARVRLIGFACCSAAAFTVR